MDLIMRPAMGHAVASREVEVVERKGVGHPDTVCDALAERLSTALCRFYMDRFGYVLHYNVDKALLWAGAARPTFGGGEILEPMEIFLAGRATLQFRGVAIDLDDYIRNRGKPAELAGEAARRNCGHEVTVEINTADNAQAGIIYMTVTGTSAEGGDDGQVGGEIGPTA